MEKPYKFIIICDLTNTTTSQNNPPLLHHLKTWVSNGKPNQKELKQTKTVYEDTRYNAKLRLYNYITYTRKGLEIPRYNPYKGTEIGKSIPILNF